VLRGIAPAGSRHLRATLLSPTARTDQACRRSRLTTGHSPTRSDAPRRARRPPCRLATCLVPAPVRCGRCRRDRLRRRCSQRDGGATRRRPLHERCPAAPRHRGLRRPARHRHRAAPGGPPCVLHRKLGELPGALRTDDDLIVGSTAGGHRHPSFGTDIRLTSVAGVTAGNRDPVFRLGQIPHAGLPSGCPGTTMTVLAATLFAHDPATLGGHVLAGVGDDGTAGGRRAEGAVRLEGCRFVLAG
jgi:hypothetical protein